MFLELVKLLRLTSSFVVYKTEVRAAVMWGFGDGEEAELKMVKLKSLRFSFRVT